jgi:hypothetical protein
MSARLHHHDGTTHSVDIANTMWELPSTELVWPEGVRGLRRAFVEEPTSGAIRRANGARGKRFCAFSASIMKKSSRIAPSSKVTSSTFVEAPSRNGGLQTGPTSM